jgi:hypothetical protein
MIKPWLASRPVWRPGTATRTWLGCMSLPRHAAPGVPTNCSTRSLTLRPAVREALGDGRGRVQYPRDPFLPLVRIRGDRSATHYGPRPKYHRDRVRVFAFEDAALAQLTRGINSWRGRFRAQVSQGRLGWLRWVVCAHKTVTTALGSASGGSFPRTGVTTAARVAPEGSFPRTSVQTALASALEGLFARTGVTTAARVDPERWFPSTTAKTCS